MFDAREKDKAFKKRELDRAKEVAQEREREEHNRSVFDPRPVMAWLSRFFWEGREGEGAFSYQLLG